MEVTLPKQPQDLILDMELPNAAKAASRATDLVTMQISYKQVTNSVRRTIALTIRSTLTIALTYTSHHAHMNNNEC